MSRIRISEAQAQAEALARRAAPFAAESRTSAGMAYDFRRRQPRDLREAERAVRRAYVEEVPTRLHEAGLADDGTPAMTARAESYIFGEDTWTDAGKGEHPIMAYYVTPLRAALSSMENGQATERADAEIASRVAAGMTGVEAAILSGAPVHWAGRIAYGALLSLLGRLSDVRVDSRAA